jgi:SAM-dependent methyltransferase
MIRWCRRNITPRHPEFEFEWAPIHNAKYNPFGTLSASEFRFPYPDSSFDFAFATSLFTHLVHDEAGHYLAETARVLKPGAMCLLTFFLLTPRSEAEIAAGRAALAFTHPVEGGATTDPAQPEEAIAFGVDEVRSLVAEAGLAVREPIHPGGWANEPGAASYQDIIVATAQR